MGKGDKGKGPQKLMEDYKIPKDQVKKTLAVMKEKNISDEQFATFFDSFKKFDKNKDMVVDEAEMEDACRCAGTNQTKKEFKQKLKKYDTDRSGVLELSEFVGMTHELLTSGSNLDAAFKAFDKDNSGKISTDELIKILTEMGEEKMSKKEARDLIKDFDKNNDGELDLKEFKNMLGGGSC